MNILRARTVKKIFPINSLQQNLDGVSASQLTNTPINIGTKTGSQVFQGWIFHNLDQTLPAFIQVFFRSASTVTLGMTAPDFTIVIAPKESVYCGYGDDEAIFDASSVSHIHKVSGLSIAATSTETGNSAPNTAITGTVFFDE